MAAVPVGFFAGLFGIGGGLISVPFLFFMFDFLNLTNDYTMHLAVGTAFFITIFTSTASVLTHRKHNVRPTQSGRIHSATYYTSIELIILSLIHI